MIDLKNEGERDRKKERLSFCVWSSVGLDE